MSAVNGASPALERDGARSNDVFGKRRGSSKLDSKELQAADLAAALGAKRQGREWVALCPAHPDKEPSLWFRDGDTRLVFKCRAGCGQDEVIDALRSRGLWSSGSFDRRPFRPRPTVCRPAVHKPDPEALAMWRSADPADDLIKRYLNNRGITLVPPSLRGSGLTMVAAVQAPNGKIIAVQTTKLTARATKVECPRPRLTHGSLGRGAVRLAAVDDVLCRQ